MEFVYGTCFVDGEEVYLREFWKNEITGERFTLENAAASEGETIEDFLKKFCSGIKPYFTHYKETEEIIRQWKEEEEEF